MTNKTQLPVDAILLEILAALQHSPNLVIEAAPGAGKTTRIPPELLKLDSGEVIVLEPRRIAARMAARRVAQQMDERLGETVGYQVRFEDHTGPRTRLRFVTEGLLTRRFLSDPELKGVTTVVLDEFHERHLDSDLALALLKRLQTRRAADHLPVLRIVVMSATLDAAALARHLDNCLILSSPGRLYPLTIENLPYTSQPLSAQVRIAFEKLLGQQRDGDILAFLPGATEIRQATRECEETARRHGVVILPLHGSLTPEEQDLAVTPGPTRKLILATNVAESSITVEGVTAVIDSGLARIASWSPWTGLPSLEVRRISKASATQRAGRAGRTTPGHVLRLYSTEDFQQRPDHETPEILRSDLSQLALTLRSMNLDAGNLPEPGHPPPSLSLPSLSWLDAPPETSLNSANSLLDRLEATGDNARQLARLPLSPRLARLVLEADRQGATEDGCLTAALLSSGNSDFKSQSNDLLSTLDALKTRRLDPRLQQTTAQIRRSLRTSPSRQNPSVNPEEALLKSVLAAFPDRVARLRTSSQTANQVQLSTGASAEILGHPPRYEFMIALDAEDRSDKPLPLIRLTARIEPEWLLDIFPNHVRQQDTLQWNRIAERVEAVSTLLYDELILDESRNYRPAPEAAAAFLAGKAIESGLDRFVEQFSDPEKFHHFLARLEFAGLASPDIEETIRELATGLLTFAELKSAAANLIPLLEQKIGVQLLNKSAPESLRLPGGRVTKIHYEQGKPPWIASRLQDFFGMKETPRIGPSQTPVVVHLLAPNQRAVQTTTDLAGFWQRLYPQVRRELMRRYPRHSWPENP
ncbi:MAG TPA: ATP-dependent helicase HrpB [Acidobacteriaceae bacterium]|nr:ATP-dependent helicase HrpB [Acidobacteriaceae bacterium]